MELTITRGRGYVSADKGKTDDMPIGVLAVDAIYTPVRPSKHDCSEHPCWTDH